MITGMGIGPELMGHVERVFKCSGVPVDFEKIDIKVCISGCSEHRGLRF